MKKINLDAVVRAIAGILVISIGVFDLLDKVFGIPVHFNLFFEGLRALIILGIGLYLAFYKPGA